LHGVRALLVVHVVLAIFLIGPLVAAANQIARSLRGSDAGVRRMLSRTITFYGWGSLLVAVFGFGLVRDEFSFSDGWLITSIVLFVVASVLVLGLLVPLLGRAATGRGETAALAPRAAAIGGIASLCYVVIAILMVWRPS
jgi:hydrogenase-4 membrane subunit HyfE